MEVWKKIRNHDRYEVKTRFLLFSMEDQKFELKSLKLVKYLIA